MHDDPRFAQAVEITIATYDRIASAYADRHTQMPPPLVARLERFVDLLPAPDTLDPPAVTSDPPPDAELEEYLASAPVLDAGCGPGQDARALAAYGLPVLAVDLSQGMLDAARERTARRLPRGSIHYALKDLRRLELPDACCRGIWCSAALLHLPRHVAPRAMAQLARVARRGAPLALSLKLAGQGPAEAFQPNPYLPLPDAERFFTYYAPEEAARLVEDAGFDVRDVAQSTDPRPPDAPGWVSVLATRL